MDLSQKHVLIVGLGGLGSPATLALLEAGVGSLSLVDDDLVEESNLHRQILFLEADVGRDKLDAARERLLERGFGAERVFLIRSRLLPENAIELVRRADLVVEGADNFATKFLTADACRLERKPVVHGAAIRWRGTVWCVRAQGRPCYRCLFESPPASAANLSCAEAGVMGPVVGLTGALMADGALRVLTGDDSVYGGLFTYDGRNDVLRRVSVEPRPSCALCGPFQSIFEIDESRYVSPDCVA